MNDITAAEVLERAADGFESGRYGWVQGISNLRKNGHQYYCATGALHLEAGVPELAVSEMGTPRFQARVELYYEAERALEKTVGIASVPQWNDNFASGLPEVIDAMKEAAKTLRNKEEAR